MSVFNEIAYLPYAIEAIYDWVDEILICDGIISTFNPKGVVKHGPDGRSNDGTFEYLWKRHLTDKKINLKYGKWSHEGPKRRYMYDNASGDYVFTVDADEIYKPKDLNYIFNLIKTEPEVRHIIVYALRFFGDFWHYADSSGAIMMKKLPGSKLYGLRNAIYKNPKYKDSKVPGQVPCGPYTACINCSLDEYNAWCRILQPTQAQYYHYSHIYDKKSAFTVDRANRKELMAKGLRHNMKDWQAKWFGQGITKQAFHKGMAIKPFKGEHPEIMKKHPYYNHIFKGSK
jgi:hypothetical protein